ncbi:MAG: heme o synthase [Halodesulfurarchaeum sp.]
MIRSDFAPIATLEDRITSLLAVSAVGVYLLVLLGAATSLLDAGRACSSWPTCNGAVVPTADPMALVALGHRVVGLVVGLVLVATVLASWRREESRIKWVVTGAALLYPIQTVIGAIIAVRGATAAIATLHLLVAMTIFSGILLGLLWHLEAVTVEPETIESGMSLRAAGAGTSGVDAGSATDWQPAQSNEEHRGSTDSADPSITEVLGSYVTLTKPRLWWLLSLVAIASMALAAGPSLSAWNVLSTVTGGVLAVAASGTFNNIVERDRDAAMDRTADRPLVDGTISVRNAWVFGFALTLASMAVFLVFGNPLAAGLGLLAILFYSVVYTMILKPNTDQNIVIGGAVGAFPALIGWAAVTNTIGLPAVVLGTVIFLWTPAHFYNLALAYKEDYARAGFPMLPVSRGEARTRRHVLLYLGATMVAAVTLGTVEALSWVYSMVAFGLGAVFLFTVISLFRERTDEAAFRSFHASNAYLGVLLLSIVLDAMVFA